MTNAQHYTILPNAVRTRGQELSRDFPAGTVVTAPYGINSPDGDGDVLINLLDETRSTYIHPEFLRAVDAPASVVNGLVPLSRAQARDIQAGDRLVVLTTRYSGGNIDWAFDPGEIVEVRANGIDEDGDIRVQKLDGSSREYLSYSSVAREVTAPVASATLGEPGRFEVGDTVEIFDGGRTLSSRDRVGLRVVVTEKSGGTFGHRPNGALVYDYQSNAKKVLSTQAAPAEAFVSVRDGFKDGNELEFTVTANWGAIRGQYNVGCKNFTLDTVREQLVSVQRNSDSEWVMRFKGTVARSDGRKVMVVGPVEITELEAREFFKDVKLTKAAEPLIDVNLKLTQAQLNALTKLAGSGNGSTDHSTTDAFAALQAAGGDSSELVVVDRSGTRVTCILNVTKRS